MLAVVLTVLSCDRGDAKARARELDTEFSARVPPGSTRESVTSFLKSHEITPFEDQSARTINASVPDVEKGFLVRSGVYMTFHFDEAGRLTRHEIKAIATGP